MKVIKIGVDLDGVVAQHPLGGFWFRLRKFKEELLKKTHDSSYYYPKTRMERLAWMVIDWFRPPLKEKDSLFALAKNKRLRFYLITGRFRFLHGLTVRWLKKNELWDCFEGVLLDGQDLEPTEFKAKKINQLSLDYFFDDDPETVSYLRKKTSAKILLEKQPPGSFIKFCQSLPAD